jgi:outer membrane receptor for ferric coprogen and ferric-rhodotorulic acid
MDKLSLGAGLNWQTSTERSDIYQEAYSLVNVMAKYSIRKDLSIQLNINNLFDKYYYSNVGQFNQVAIGNPRNYTANLTYKF